VVYLLVDNLYISVFTEPKFALKVHEEVTEMEFIIQPVDVSVLPSIPVQPFKPA
jgi:hypothetical protein